MSRRLSFPDGTCPFSDIKYGSRAYAMGRNWDCVTRGTYGRDTLCPCYDCFRSYYTAHHVKLQSICRMLIARKRYITLHNIT